MEMRNWTVQDKKNAQAYDDGQRCAKKGFGITKSGHYDYQAWHKMFLRGFRKGYPSISPEEAYEFWKDGFQDELDRLALLRKGFLDYEGGPTI